MKKYFQIFVFTIVVLYSSYAFSFFFNIGMSNIKPLYWHFLVIFTAISFLIIGFTTEKTLIHRNYGIWLWLFLINNIICYLYSSQNEIETEALITSLETVALLASFYFLLKVQSGDYISRLALLLVSLFSVLMNIIDFFTPTWSFVPGRAAGFYLNPTIAGKILVLSMVISIPIIPKYLRLLYCGLIGIGVLVTFSRGPWILWMIAIIGLSITGYLKYGGKALSIIMVSVLAGFTVYSALTGGILGLLNALGFNDYLTYATMNRLGESGTAFTDYSAASRLEAAVRAWEVFSNSPWFGAGLAIDQNWIVGSHNTYLRMAAEGGIVRLAILLSLLVILWKITDSTGKVALLVYVASCFTAHDNIQAPAMLLILSIIAITTNRQSETVSHRSSIYTGKIMAIETESRRF